MMKGGGGRRSGGRGRVSETAAGTDGSTGWSALRGRLLRKGADFHALDQVVIEGETMGDAQVGKDGSGEVAHDLVDFDDDVSVGFFVKGDRFHVRVDLAPLLAPVSADFFGATDKSPFEGARPGDVGRHEGEGGGDVAGVEGGVGGAEEFDVGGGFIWRREWHEGGGLFFGLI